MLIFNNKTHLKQNEIIAEFEKFEDDVPSAFNPLAMFLDSRVGLHVKFENNLIIGYYESGEISTRGGLLGGKNYFWCHIREKNSHTVIKGVVVFAPSFVLFLLVQMLILLFYSEKAVFNMIVWIAIFFLLFGHNIYTEQHKTLDLINQICSIKEA